VVFLLIIYLYRGTSQVAIVVSTLEMRRHQLVDPENVMFIFFVVGVCVQSFCRNCFWHRL